MCWAYDPRNVTQTEELIETRPKSNNPWLVGGFVWQTSIFSILCGQIITTSAEVTLNGGLIRELPQNPLNSGLGIILICPDTLRGWVPKSRKFSGGSPPNFLNIPRFHICHIG